MSFFKNLIGGAKSSSKKAKKKAIKKRRLRAETEYESLLGSFDLVAKDMTAIGEERERLSQLQEDVTKIGKSKVVDKRKIENLLKAAGMREAQLRAQKAAPGFNQARSLVG
jgi:hypothetical protein